MKRHLPLAILRVILAGVISITLPVAFTKLGPTPSTQADGQKMFGIIMDMWLFGAAVGAGYLVFGSIFQLLLRRKPAKWTLIVDLTLFVMLSAILAYAATGHSTLDSCYPHINWGPPVTAP